MRRAARPGINPLAAVLALAVAAWALPGIAAADYRCPKVQLETGDDGQTAVRLLEAELPKGHRFYALTMASRALGPDDWLAITADRQSAAPRYLVPLGQHWLYLVTTPGAWPGRNAYAIKPPSVEDTKGAKFFHGPAPRWLELENEPDPLPGLPKAARVCSLEW